MTQGRERQREDQKKKKQGDQNFDNLNNLRSKTRSFKAEWHTVAGALNSSSFFWKFNESVSKQLSQLRKNMSGEVGGKRCGAVRRGRLLIGTG